MVVNGGRRTPEHVWTSLVGRLVILGVPAAISIWLSLRESPVAALFVCILLAIGAGFLITKFDKGYRQALASAPPEELREGSPDPAFLGEFLVWSFISEHFGITDVQMDDFVAPLREDLRGQGSLWINLYLCWLFRMKVRAQYGDEFFDEAFNASRARLAKGEHLGNGTKGFADALAHWFERLDSSSSSLGQEVNGVQVPMEIFAAWSFLALTPESPFYRQAPAELPEGVDFEVAEVLERAKAKAWKSIEYVVECGGQFSRKAAGQGDASAQYSPSLTRQMTPAEIADLQTRTREWMEAFEKRTHQKE